MRSEWPSRKVGGVLRLHVVDPLHSSMAHKVAPVQTAVVPPLGLVWLIPELGRLTQSDWAKPCSKASPAVAQTPAGDQRSERQLQRAAPQVEQSLAWEVGNKEKTL